LFGSDNCSNGRRLINETLEEFRVHIMYPTTCWVEGPVSFAEVIISEKEKQFLEGCALFDLVHILFSCLLLLSSPGQFRDEIAKVEQLTGASINLRLDKPCVCAGVRVISSVT
jgi:hypothetical protein